MTDDSREVQHEPEVLEGEDDVPRMPASPIDPFTPENFQAGYPGGKGLPPFELQVRNDDALPRVIEAVQAMWQRELGIQVVASTD